MTWTMWSSIHCQNRWVWMSDIFREREREGCLHAHQNDISFATDKQNDRCCDGANTMCAHGAQNKLVFNSNSLVSDCFGTCTRCLNIDTTPLILVVRCIAANTSEGRLEIQSDIRLTQITFDYISGLRLPTVPNLDRLTFQFSHATCVHFMHMQRKSIHLGGRQILDRQVLAVTRHRHTHSLTY